MPNNRTFDNLACPRGVAADEHEIKGYTDVLYAPGVIGEYAAVACVADEALLTIPTNFYVHPDQIGPGEKGDRQ